MIECDPPRKLAITFNVNWPDLIERLGPTLVAYEIAPARDAVRLTMTESHDRPLSDDILSGGRSGWSAILSSLKSLLETGKALSIKMEPPKQMLAALKAMGPCENRDPCPAAPDVAGSVRYLRVRRINERLWLWVVPPAENN